jgi:hypothetical protein
MLKKNKPLRTTQCLETLFILSYFRNTSKKLACFLCFFGRLNTNYLCHSLCTDKLAVIVKLNYIMVNNSGYCLRPIAVSCSAAVAKPACLSFLWSLSCWGNSNASQHTGCRPLSGRGSWGMTVQTWCMFLFCIKYFFQILFKTLFRALNNSTDFHIILKNYKTRYMSNSVLRRFPIG